MCVIFVCDFGVFEGEVDEFVVVLDVGLVLEFVGY